MDPVKTIGHLLNGNEQRDCIHIAIMPAIAASNLSRGEEVGLVYGTTDQVVSKDSVYGIPSIGIVDPFYGIPAVVGEGQFKWRIEKGQRCWVFLFPGTVTGMRHQWTLPAIDEHKPPVSESEKWLRQFADRWNFDYDEMIAEARTSGGYITARGRDLHSPGDLGEDEALFWEHFQNLTGSTFDTEHRQNFTWSCTC